MSWFEDKIKEWESSDDSAWLRVQLVELGEHVREYEKTARDTEKSLRTRAEKAEAERDAIETATAKRCAEIALGAKVVHYNTPKYALSLARKAILAAFPAAKEEK